MAATTYPTQAIGASESRPTSAAKRSFRFTSAFLATVVAIIAGFTQGYNMFSYPYFQDSEGTNISHAIALIEDGSLSPYTYDYDEAPVGSLILSAWVAAVGDIDSFGFSISTGRVMMLVVHVMTVLLIYAIAFKLTNNDLVAIIAALVFTLSPLVTVLQRRVLLDNLMLLWLMASVYSAVGDNRRIAHYIFSAIFFAIAVLTRGSAIYFLPALIFIIRGSSSQYHRRFANSLWLTVALAIISMFPLYAAMRLELFPQGWWLFSGDYPHVSLYERILDRGPATGRILDYGNNLIPVFVEWTFTSFAAADPILVYFGAACVLFVSLMSVENRKLRPVFIFFVSYLILLLFGGRVVHSDIIPILPFLAISVGIFVGLSVRWVTKNTPTLILGFLVGVLTIIILLYPFGVFYLSATYMYETDQTSGQTEAVEWITTYLPADSVIVTDNYAFTELREVFPNAHHYWKVDTDPDIQLNQLGNNWCNIDYIVASPQLTADITTFDLSLLSSAWDNSSVLIEYENAGWPLQVRRVSKQLCPIDSLTTES